MEGEEEGTEELGVCDVVVARCSRAAVYSGLQWLGCSWQSLHSVRHARRRSEKGRGGSREDVPPGVRSCSLYGSGDSP